jgi:hypothetical protein
VQSKKDIRERVEKIAFLLHIAGEVSNFCDLFLQLCNFSAFLAFETCDEVCHFALQWVFDLDRDVEAFGVVVEILVDPDVSGAEEVVLT